MPTVTKDSKPRRRGTPRDTSAARASRWTPEARIASAIRVLVEKAPELTPEQETALRGIFARRAVPKAGE